MGKEEDQIMMPGKLRESKEELMAVFERNGSTDGPVISFVVAIVQLALTEWLSRVNQCPDHFMPQRKGLKGTESTVLLPVPVLGRTGPLPQIHIYPEPGNVT